MILQTGTRVRVKKANELHPWHGNTGTVVRTPRQKTKHDHSIETVGKYSMTFDGREGTFAPLDQSELEAI